VNDPIAMLKRDHREVEELLTKLSESKPGPRRRGNVDKVEAALTLHMRIEEQLLYPLVARVVGQEEAEEAGIEHGLVREGLKQMRTLVDEPGFGAVVEMLKAGIKHHVREEEKEIFPELKREVDRETLAEIGDQMAAEKSPGRARRTTRKSTAGRKATARKTAAGRGRRSASYVRNPAGSRG
jgi:iron-sulfur cluster repair protein YtfE (RIC family)